MASDGDWRKNSTQNYEIFSAVGSKPHFHYTGDRKTGMVHGTFVQEDGSKVHFPVSPSNVVGGPFPTSVPCVKPYEAGEASERADLARRNRERSEQLTRRLEAQDALEGVRLANHAVHHSVTLFDYSHYSDEVHVAERPVIQATSAPSRADLLRTSPFFRKF